MTTRPRKIPLIAAGKFKARCLAMFDEVAGKGRSFIVTKRGRPVACISPVVGSARSLVGTLVYEDDLLSPVGVEWDAQRARS